MNSDPLETALADCQKPIPASNAESCRDLLERQRRITVRDHERWQHTGKPPHENDADLTELLTELQSERNHHE